MKFNIQTEEMTMIVQIDSSDKTTKSSDVSNLSGGERSYVTLCLLLALGHVVCIYFPLEFFFLFPVPR